MYASPTYAIIGSDNGLVPVRHQAVIWTNAVLLTNGPLKQTSVKLYWKFQTFSFIKNAFEYVVWKISTILSRPQRVNTMRLVPDGWNNIVSLTTISFQHHETYYADILSNL